MSPESGPTGRRTAFVFAGGGTGGHIYPALAIIEQLRAIDSSVDVHILCSDRVIDTEILDKETVAFEPIPAKPVSKKPKGLIKFVTSYGPSVRATRVCIRRLKETNDQVVLVAMGGFVAAPSARGGHAEHAPVTLVNLDAIPGKANVLIGKKATNIFSAAPIKGFESWTRVRPIVRSQTDQAMDQHQARSSFGLDPDTKTLLITGGSQGAASITNFVRAMVDRDSSSFDGWQIIHQIGNQIPQSEIDELKSVYQSVGINAWVERYIDKMGIALISADLAIGRCGAGTVAECWASRVPSVFFPYPYHKDEHQKHNAQVLVDSRCAIVLSDHVDPAKNYEAHHEAFTQILTNDEARRDMGAGFDELGTPDGAEVIARALMGR